MRLLSTILALLAALALCVAVAHASEDAQRSGDIASQLESPFCPGRTLDVCSSPAAAEWRHEIDKWVADGVASDEIKARLSKRAGRDLRAVPSNNAAYWVLGGVLLAVLLLFYVVGKRLLGRSGDDDDSEPPVEDDADDVDEELDQRLDDELALLE